MLLVRDPLNIASSKSLYIGAYNRPNATDEQSINSFVQSLAKLPRDSSHIWLAGDMNLPDQSGCRLN